MKRASTLLDLVDFCINKFKIMNNVNDIWNEIINVKWSIHEYYGQSYLTPEEHSKQISNICKLRQLKAISIEDRLCIRRLFDTGVKHYHELQSILQNKPRIEAQKYISKKSVREKVFKLHGYNCLKCGDDKNISLDHIIPVFHNGENSIDNLQPLCRSCNSKKGTKIIDYRNLTCN